jgi:hypothetical protein
MGLHVVVTWPSHGAGLVDGLQAASFIRCRWQGKRLGVLMAFTWPARGLIHTGLMAG